MTEVRHHRREMQGIVTSAKTAKTITVEVERTYKHSRYGKYIRSRKKYLAHDEERTAREGDVVLITSTRPLSKRKRWRLLNGSELLPDVIAGVQFNDGVKSQEAAA